MTTRRSEGFPRQTAGRPQRAARAFRGGGSCGAGAGAAPGPAVHSQGPAGRLGTLPVGSASTDPPNRGHEFGGCVLPFSLATYSALRALLGWVYSAHSGRRADRLRRAGRVRWEIRGARESAHRETI